MCVVTDSYNGWCHRHQNHRLSTYVRDRILMVAPCKRLIKFQPLGVSLHLYVTYIAEFV